MYECLLFICGIVIGSFVGILLMSCIQINRDRKYEIKEKRDEKDS